MRIALPSIEIIPGEGSPIPIINFIPIITLDDVEWVVEVFLANLEVKYGYIVYFCAGRIGLDGDVGTRIATAAGIIHRIDHPDE